MKQFVKFFTAAVVIISFAANAFSQVSTTATATAVIITPIAISKTTDMNFGNIAVNASPGTVVLSPAGARSTTGGCTLPAVTGTVSQAVFNVTGQANATYSITLPANHTISSGANNMTVDVFTSNPTPTGTLSAGGSETLNVGATLNVAGSQASGTYTNAGGFTVTVNYN